MSHSKENRIGSRVTVSRIAAVTFILILITWSSWVCKDSITDGSLGDIVFPETNVSYGNQVEPLFLRSCAITGCHDHENMAAGVNFETYQDAISKPLVIIPGDTVNSHLVWSLRRKNNVPLMPPAERPQLTENQKLGLKRWIYENATNN